MSKRHPGLLPAYSEAAWPGLTIAGVVLCDAVEGQGLRMGDSQEQRQHVSAGHYLDTAITYSAVEQSAALAAQMFGFPIALVNVLDAGTRHTIASVGAALGSAPRASTLCDETVRNGVPVVRGEVHTPPASAPHIRAYVAVPLTGREGLVIGTLCLLDTRPHRFSAEQMVQLLRIGAVVQDQLEMLRRRGPHPPGSIAEATELAAAVEAGQIVPFYQPIIDLRTGAVSALEALARWKHPVRGVLAPTEFIPLAEDTEIIIDLDLAVLAQVVVDFAQCQQRHRSLRLNVNLSSRHFDHPDCVGRITAAVTDAGVSPDAVNLEVTETAALAAHPHERSFLTELHEEGFQIVLDDFGTGFSVLEHVLKLPIDGIKLDGALVAALGTRTGDALVRTLVNFAADLDLSTVLEGVQTPEHAAHARRLGCTHAQGYLWAPPLPSADITDLLPAQH